MRVSCDPPRSLRSREGRRASGTASRFAPQRPGQKTARAWRVAELPIRRSKLDSELRAVADAHEEGRRVVGIGFGPSREQQFILCCCTFRFARGRFVLTTRGQDLRIDGAILGIVGDFEQRRDERGSDVQAVRARARPRRDARVPERAPAISRRARRRSPPHVPDRRGASRSRPIRRAVGRTGKVRRHHRHRARPHSRFRPPPIDPFPRAAMRARRACGFQRSSVASLSRRTSASLIPSRRLEQRRLFEHRSLALDTRPRALDREACLLPRSDGNAPRAAHECRAHRAVSGDNAIASFATDFRPVMIHDPAEQVAANKQKLRQREQVFERRTFDTREAPGHRSTPKDWRRRFARSYSVRRRSS